MKYPRRCTSTGEMAIVTKASIVYIVMWATKIKTLLTQHPDQGPATAGHQPVNMVPRALGWRREHANSSIRV